MKNLKNTFVICLVALFMANAAVAQTKRKTNRYIRKELSRLEKEGYKFPSGVPIKYQLEAAYKKQMEKDESGKPLYLFASNCAIGENLTEAKQIACDAARLELAGSIACDVEDLLKEKQDYANNDYDGLKRLLLIREIVKQEIGRIIPLFEFYRNADEKVEIYFEAAYSSELAKKIAKDVATNIITKELVADF